MASKLRCEHCGIRFTDEQDEQARDMIQRRDEMFPDAYLMDASHIQGPYSPYNVIEFSGGIAICTHKENS